MDNKQDLISLLKAMHTDFTNMRDLFKSDHQYAMSNRYAGKAQAIETVLSLLQSDRFYENIKSIYHKG